MYDQILDRKILLIDDEVKLLKLMETVLKKEGFRRIFKARDGIEEIKLCKDEKPDIVVLDIMMAHIDGFDVCKLIRKFSFVTVIFLSAKRYGNTIMVHIRKFRQKLEEDPSNPKYIITVKGLGYKLNIS